MSTSALAAAGSTAARAAAMPAFAVPAALPIVNTQLKKRSSKAPLCRTPYLPKFDIASTGIIVLTNGASAIASACCVAPAYDVPMVPIDPFDHDCAPIHLAVSAPSFGSSVIGRQRPPDLYRPRTSWMTTAYPRGT